MNRILSGLTALSFGLALASAAAPSAPPGPENRMFVLPEGASRIEDIDWARLPVMKSERGTIFRAQQGEAGYNMHGYVAYHDGQFWAMWSSGLEFEDFAGQQVRYAVSRDGLSWGPAGVIAAVRADGDFRFIARGFWQREGELLALASRDEAWTVEDGVKKKGRYFGPGLQLQYFKLNARRDGWEPGGVVSNDTINNYEPHLTPAGEWMMSRRNHLKVPSMIVGGVTSPGSWRVVELPSPADGHEMSEPGWWTLPDGRLAMMFRDDSRSFRLYRSFSADAGNTWTPPAATDFPDGRAKSNILRLRDGRYVLVNNPRPGDARIPLCLSVSDDGVIFGKMRVLLGEPTQARDPNYSKRAGYQYPHLLEAEKHLFVVFAQNQEDIGILRIKLSDL